MIDQLSGYERMRRIQNQRWSPTTSRMNSTRSCLQFVAAILLLTSQVQEVSGFSSRPLLVVPLGSSLTHRVQRLGNDRRLSVLSSAPSDDDFWSKQKRLAEEMNESANTSLKSEQKAFFDKRRDSLIGDTAYFSVLIFAVLWCSARTVFTPVSYAFGTICGLAYSYGLAKYVETIGESPDEDEMVEGAGLGQARFAFLFLLIIFIGKFRSTGLQEIPAILGFFTYQLASLSQGLKQIDD